MGEKMRIGIFHYLNPEALKCALELKEWLKNKGHEPVRNKLKGIDLAIILGGDGTILHTANRIARRGLSVPIIRINFGTVGFLTNVDPCDVRKRLNEFLNGENHIFVNKSRISVVVKKNGRIRFSGDALNEAFVDRTSVKATSFVLENRFQGGAPDKATLKGDGIIFSTKTGSTAYNRSAGGPILLREDNMAITMICPTDHPWSRVVHLDEYTQFALSGFQKENARLTIDGRLIMHLDPEDVITVGKSEKDTIFVEFGNQT
jgi:NAD+ kinase